MSNRHCSLRNVREKVILIVEIVGTVNIAMPILAIKYSWGTSGFSFLLNVVGRLFYYAAIARFGFCFRYRSDCGLDSTAVI